MIAVRKLACIICASALCFVCLGACANGNGGAGNEGTRAASTSQGQDASREEAEAVLMKAAKAEFANLTFSMKTETTATGPDDDGVMQTQSVQSTTSGELDTSGDKPRIHIGYSLSSTVEFGRATYDMYLDQDRLMVVEGDQLYIDTMTDEMLDSYADSITNVIEPEEITSMLDLATSCKSVEDDEGTTVTITVDTDKLSAATDEAASEGEGGEADSLNEVASAIEEAASLPEDIQISTMVVSYTVGPDGRFRAARLISSTSGTPTYHVSQTYRFSDYDTTELPEWPDLQAYIAKQSGIETDADGRMYIEQDGQIYYVTEISDDGTVYFDTNG